MGLSHFAHRKRRPLDLDLILQTDKLDCAAKTYKTVYRVL